MAAIATELPAPFGASFSMDLLIKAKFCRCVQVKLDSVQCVLHVWYTCDSLCQYSAVVMLGEGGGVTRALCTHIWTFITSSTHTASAHFILNQQFHECDAPKGAEISAAIAAMF